MKYLVFDSSQAGSFLSSNVTAFLENKNSIEYIDFPNLPLASLQEADVLVFAYPIYWGYPPTDLVSIIQNGFIEGVAYQYNVETQQVQGLFKDKKAVIILSAGKLEIPDYYYQPLVDSLIYAGIKEKDISTHLLLGITKRLSSESANKFLQSTRTFGEQYGN